MIKHQRVKPEFYNFCQEYVKDRKNKVFYIFFVLLFTIYLIPLFLVRIPPLVDYPNHLARMHLLINIDNSSFLQEYYKVQWAVLPNLAMDIIVPLFAQVMPLDWAGKCFIALIFFLLSSGTTALHYVVHRQLSFWSLLAFLFIYNNLFLWGFLNFLFGIGLCLWIFAGWIYFEKQSAWIRIILFSILSIFLFFSHLFSLGIYGLCILGYEIYRLYENYYQQSFKYNIYNRFIAFIQFLPSAFLLIFLSPTVSNSESHKIIFGDFSRKIDALLGPVNNYFYKLDVLTILLIFFLFSIAVFTRKIKIPKNSIILLCIIISSFFFMPAILLSAHNVDERIPIVFPFLLIAVSQFKSKITNWTIIIFFILISAAGIRHGILIYHWIKADNVYSQYIDAFQKMNKGTKLISAIGHSKKGWCPFPAPVIHIPCLSIIESSAFVPSLFAYPTQQPITFTKSYKNIAKQTKTPFQIGSNLSTDWYKLTNDYDYLLVVNEHYFDNKIPTEFKKIYCGSNFQFLKVKKTNE